MKVLITPFRAEEVQAVPVNWGCLQHIWELIGPFAPDAILDALRVEFPGVTFAVPERGQAPGDAVDDADAVLGWLSPAAFAHARRLRWIQAFSSGVDWTLDLPDLADRGVVVTNMRGTSADTIAEHAFAQLLCLTRHLRYFDAEQRQRRWRDILGVPLGALSGLTMGIVGLGSIGQALARRARAFDMDVIALVHERLPDEPSVSQMWRRDGLEEFLSVSDVVVVTAPITPETRDMLGPRQLALLKPTAYVIVLSRGGIVDEAAIVDMLRDGRLAGAAMDVAAQEPPAADSLLWDAPNLILTPHCSGYSRQTSLLIWRAFRENLARFIAREALHNVVHDPFAHGGRRRGT